MAEPGRSAVIAFREETTEGTLLDVSAATQYVPLREGYSFTSNVESIDSNEFLNDLGGSKSFTTKESPTGSLPKYLKHSGIEGQAPMGSILMKSAFGNQTTNATQYDTVAASTAGTAAARAVVKVDVGEGASFSKGQALLIKDGANGYSIRNVHSVSSDDLSLNFNLASAPAAAVNLGKAIHFSSAVSGHPTFSSHLYQASNGSAYHLAMAGCRTTSMGINLAANSFAECNFEFSGINFFYNPLRVTAAVNDKIDFNDGTDKVCTLSAKVYKTPHELAAEITTKMTAAGLFAVTCVYSNSTGKYSITTAGGVLSLLWNTGVNTAVSVGTTIGFLVAADDTGSTTYTSDNALTYSPTVQPAYDVSDNLVVKGNELLIGSYFENSNRQGSTVSFSVSTAKQDISDFTSETGVSASIISSRQVEFSSTLILAEHEIGFFDKFVNNTTTSIMFNCGPKSAGNWVAGKCVNVYVPNASITSHVIATENTYQVIQLTAKGFVDSNNSDVHLNFV